MLYPIGIQSFSDIIEKGFVYADKTDLVYKLATEGKVYFLSRPRRFGKSLLLSTLENYFLGRKELFKGLKIDSLEKDWTEHPVFMFSFARGEYVDSEALKSNLDTTISAAEREYGNDPKARTFADRFYYVLKAAYEKTGRQAVVLIDEYDKPLLDVMALNKTVKDSDGSEMSIEDYNRNILKGFYGVFKDSDRYLRFVMLTGVTKFSQISVFSGFNQPDDISMSVNYEALCGITKDELVTVFDEPIRELAKKKNWSYDETVAALKKRYDGYHFGDNMTDIFNPFSLINCFSKMKISDYWFKTGTPSYLLRLLSSNNANISDFLGKYFRAAEFEDYRADAQRPLPMLYQSGYLTIKGYDDDEDRYLLDFPNDEVRIGFIDAMAYDCFGSISKPMGAADEMRETLETGDVEEFINLITEFLASVPYELLRKNDKRECERHFHTVFYLIVYMILRRKSTKAEPSTSQGRVDCVIECPDYVYVVEFKLDGSADAALRQINNKGYAKPFAADKRKVISLGINFSSKTGTIDDWKAAVCEKRE